MSFSPTINHVRGTRRRLERKWSIAIGYGSASMKTTNPLSLNDLSKTDGGAADDPLLSTALGEKHGRITPSDSDRTQSVVYYRWL